MELNKYNMKNNSKKARIDKHGLCLNEYKNNNNNAKVYYARSIGKAPEMEVSKAISMILKPMIKLIVFYFQSIICVKCQKLYKATSLAKHS